MNTFKKLTILFVVLAVNASLHNSFSAEVNTSHPEKQSSTSIFDYYLVDPQCDGSCITSNRGGAWSEFQYYAPHDYSGIWGVDGRDIYLGVRTNEEENGVTHYHEGTWLMEYFDRLDGASFAGKVMDVWGFSTTSIFAIAAMTEVTNSGLVLFYSTGGTWQEITFNNVSRAFTSLWGASPQDIYSVGDLGNVAHWDGAVMSLVDLGTTENLNEVWGTSSSDVFVAGDNGTIFHFDGATWSSQTTTIEVNINGLWGTAPDNVYAACDDGYILHYNGNSWTEESHTADDRTLNAIYGSSPDDIFAVGYVGAILHYDGTIWNDASYGSGSEFHWIWGGMLSDGDQFWADGFEHPVSDGNGVNDYINAMVEFDGGVAVAGNFEQAGSQDITRIGLWNGSNWSPIYNTEGPDDWVSDLVVYDDDLIAVGKFNKIDNHNAVGLAAWNGAYWRELVIGLDQEIHDVLIWDGKLVSLGGPGSTGIWDGEEWTLLDGFSGTFYCATVYNGELYAGGSTSPPGVFRLANDNQWIPLDNNWTEEGTIESLLAFNGGLYVGGLFSGPFQGENNLAVWSSETWQSTGINLDNKVLVLGEYQGEIFVGGEFTHADGMMAGHCLLYDGMGEWRPLGSGISGSWISSFYDMGSGLYVGGDFSVAGNQASSFIALFQPEILSIPGAPDSGPAVSGQDHTVSINITGDPGPNPVYLNYRLRDEDPFLGAVMIPSTTKDGVFEATVPGEFFGDLGFQYYVTSGNGLDPVFYPESAPEEPAFTGVMMTSESMGLAPSNQYVMIGVPFVPDKDLGGILTDALGSYENWRWRFGRWNSTSSSYQEYPAVDAVAPGRGYWLIQKDPVVIPASGVTTSTVGNVVVTLEPGWNMVATPYNFPISWSDVIRGANVDQDLVGRSGGGYVHNLEIMNPWEAYWVRNNSNFITAPLVIPPISVAKKGNPTPVKTQPPEPDSWQIIFNADCDGRFAYQNIAGVSTEAHGGIDVHDSFAPPALPGDVEFLFELTTDQKVRYLTRDLREPFDVGASWDILIRREGRGWVDLTIENGQMVPGTHEVALVTPEGTVDLRETSQIRLNVDSTGEVRLRLAVGDPEFVQQQEQSLPRPFSQRAVYPNPFNPKATLSFTLPQKSHVSLDVFDIRGRLVRQVVDGEFNPGLHETVWNGLDDAGRSVSTGIYFSYLRAGGFIQTRKMTLVR